MRTNIDIDEVKMASLMEKGNYKTKKEAINQAMETQIRFLILQELDKMRGPDMWIGNLDEMRTYDKWDDSI